ncbi:ATP-binding protein [Herbiconiux moechotypicola]|uniref:Histidine kinase/HSP90-like ATPase domain-containing protein n=1 Tax=Herbiconiux moechotypicola TaxID=637393 RepID=A0ABP5QEW1_9MICO|nr:ATP-binding protein [Herbiconiux moechotypicola]MCS5729628.1 ATP-binding protein [Herbiconiux moechotypicola]
MDEQGWARRSLERALQRAILLVCLVWNLLMPVVIVVGDHRDATPAIVVAVLHVLVAAGMLGALLGRVPPTLPVLAPFVVAAADWVLAASADGVLALASAWTWDFALIASAFLLGRLGTVVCLAATVGMPTVLLLSHPGWPISLIVAVTVTPAAILLVAKVALRALRAFAAGIDETAQEAEASVAEAAASEAARRATSENARTLHDTAVNTLGAIAAGGAAVRDADEVRRRCASDVEALESVMRGDDAAPRGWSLPGSLPGHPLLVTRRGPGDDELEYVAASVPLGTREAIARATLELLQNVERHSGARAAAIEVTVDGAALEVTVSDEGSGFDGRLRPGHGLAESVVGRLADAGVRVAIDSEPGRGTRVTMTCPLGADGGAADTAVDDVDRAVEAIRRRAGLSWSFGVVAVGVLLRLADDPVAPSGTTAMLAIVLVLTLLVVGLARFRPAVPVLIALSVLVAPAAFLLGYAGTDFGTADVGLWQALGPSVPLVLLLMLSRQTRPFALGCAALVVTVVVTAGAAMVAGGQGLMGLAIVVVGGAVPVLIGVAWFLFYRGLTTIGRRAHAESLEVSAMRRDSVMREAVDVSRARWRAAGLSASLDVLRGLAIGRLDPGSSGVQQLCGREEAYLRQLMLLDPATIRLGAWYARMLREAHSRRVRVSIRGGGLDVDEASADLLGGFLVEIAQWSGPGASLVVGVFEVEGLPRVTVVGPASDLARARPAFAAGAGWNIGSTEFGEQALLEIVRSRSHDEESGSRWDSTRV